MSVHLSNPLCYRNPLLLHSVLKPNKRSLGRKGCVILDIMIASLNDNNVIQFS
jgi:hypothetical protein